MTNDTANLNPGPEAPRLPPPRGKVSPRMMTAGVVLAVLALGAAGGAGATRYVQRSRPQPVLLLQPAPIAQLQDRTPVAVKGQVAEVFGNKFIIQDDSGRTLIETGPCGKGGKLVAKGDTVTVQGHFDNGFVHANVLTRADGTSEAFGPPRPPHGPGRGPDDRPGPDRGPDVGPGPDAGPPPR